MSAVQNPVDKKLLQSLVPLDGLSESHFDEIAKKSIFEEIKPGKFIFKKGDEDGMSCYVLSGDVELLEGRKVVSAVQGGTDEARHAIGNQQPRQLSAKAKTTATVMRVNISLLDMMLTWDQSSYNDTSDIKVAAADDGEDWMTRMLSSELFLRLPALNLQQLLVRLEGVPYKAGDVVVKQGDKGDYYYVIKQGKCAVTRKPSSYGRSVKLAELSEGTGFGEESLLSGAERNATITMMTDGQMMRLSKKDFDELLKGPLIEKLDYRHACELVRDGGVWLDVRLQGEFENAHLPGSINMPLSGIRQAASTLDTSKSYIVYCDTGRRSASAAFLLGQQGYAALVLKDGLNGIPHNAMSLESTADVQPAAAEVININRDKSPDYQQPGDSASHASNEHASALADEITSLKEEVHTLKEKNTAFEEQIKELQTQEEKHQQELSRSSDVITKQKSYQDEITKLKQDLDETNSHAEDYKTQLKDGYKEQQEVLASSQQHEQESHQYLEELTVLRKDAELLPRLQQETIDLKEESTLLQGQLNELQGELTDTENKLENAQTESESRGKDAGGTIVDLENEIKTLKAGEKEQNEAKVLAEKTLKELQQQNESIQASFDESRGVATGLEDELGQLKGQITGLESERTKLEQELAGLQEQQGEQKQESSQQLESLNTETESLKQQLEEKKSEREQQKNENERLVKSLEEAEKAGSRVDELSHEIEDFQSRLEESGSSREDIEKELDTLRDQLDKSREEQKRESEKLRATLGSAEKSSADHVKEFEHEIEQLRSQLDEAEKYRIEADEQKGQLEKLEKIKSSLEIDLSSLQEDLDTQGNEVDNRSVDLKKELKDVKKNLKEEARERERAEKLQQELKDEIEKHQEKLQESESEKQSFIKELDSLKEQAGESESDLHNKMAGLEKNIATLQQNNEQLEETRQQTEVRIGSLEDENKTLISESESKRQELNSRIEELNEELAQMREKAESSSDQSEIFAIANEKITKLEEQLQAFTILGQENDENIKKLESDLAESKQMAEQAVQYKDELESIKDTMTNQEAENKNELGAVGTKLVRENELLKKELQNIFEAQELSIETGSAVKHTPASPGDIQQILDDEYGREGQAETDGQVDNSPANIPERDESDLFASAKIDVGLLQPNAGENENKKTGAMFVVMLLVGMLAGGGGIFWFTSQTELSVVKVPAKTTVAAQKKTGSEGQASNINKKTAPTKKVKQVKRKPLKSAVSKPPVASTPVKKKTAGVVSGRVYRDTLKAGGEGPIMVEISKGSFKMGSGSSSVHFDERPQHTVRIKAFSMSRYEVSFEDYDAFVRDTGSSKPGDNAWGRGKRPVINVSWDDATAYAKWLSQQTGKVYRLPTEAEWEYAVRAGTTSRFIWGKKHVKGMANCFNCGSKWDGSKTAPVGSFKPNRLGLFDMSGNVMEWTQDCYNANYQAAPYNGSAWLSGDCASRITRGGAYRSTINNLRVSKRAHFAKDTSVDNIGIRLVRER